MTCLAGWARRGACAGSRWWTSTTRSIWRESTWPRSSKRSRHPTCARGQSACDTQRSTNGAASPTRTPSCAAGPSRWLSTAAAWRASSEPPSSSSGPRTTAMTTTCRPTTPSCGRGLWMPSGRSAMPSRTSRSRSSSSRPTRTPASSPCPPPGPHYCWPTRSTVPISVSLSTWATASWPARTRRSQPPWSGLAASSSASSSTTATPALRLKTG
mmetsp:Transcript_716/g.2151  ORF Transcript_716/g.2151 Transcript_716/m.2151 type:complete len:213 (+) Transcript_716:2624-3262(+)